MAKALTVPFDEDLCIAPDEVREHYRIAKELDRAPRPSEGRTLVPVPDEGEQVDLAANLEACNAKISTDQRKHGALTALFRTLLHQLMTAQLRVHDLDMERIPEQAVPGILQRPLGEVREVL